MIKDIPGIVENITTEVSNFTDIAVLGMSGGADSTLVAIMCGLALGPENVYTLHMPYGETDYTTFNRTSVRIATHLGLNRESMCIAEPCDRVAFKVETVTKDDMSRLNLGNLRSRMRSVMLYTYGCSIAEETGKRVRVMGTGNMSEDFIGYDTKGGDALADIFPIGELYKSEVYQLLDHFRDANLIEDDMIDREPSAGLWEGQKDTDELEYTYDEMEPAILRAVNGELDHNLDVDQYVLNRNLANSHKHEAPPTIAVGAFRDQELVIKMMRCRL